MKCNLIGAGRLGKNIALALCQTGLISSLNIYNRQITNAISACHEIGFGNAVAQLELLPAADITWICTNDDAIAPTVALLAQQPLQKGSFIVHCSGLLNSSILTPLKKYQCSVASLHPLKAFKSNYLSAHAFHGVDCVLEGDGEVSAWLQPAFTSLGAQILSIKAEHKAKYHAAACIAANYLITLAAYSEALFLDAELDAVASRRMLINLMQSNLDNLQHSPTISEALTGPLTRGDMLTITAHLHALADNAALPLYKAAALSTLPLTHLTAAQQEQIRKLLTSTSSCFP